MLCVGAWSSSGALSPRSPGLPSLRHRAQTSFIWLATDNSGKCMYSSVASSLEGTPSAKISRKADVEPPRKRRPEHDASDRKSTRLNSSHLVISYAVFCLKKKKKKR